MKNCSHGSHRPCGYNVGEEVVAVQFYAAA
jgi:hypothetical protein